MKSWKTEVCVNGEWVTNSLRFATKEEAVQAGNELLERWTTPTESRAAESDDPVNYFFSLKTESPQKIEKSNKKEEV